MPFGWFTLWRGIDYEPAPPGPRQGKSRGVTKSPKRAKRRNRKKP